MYREFITSWMSPPSAAERRYLRAFGLLWVALLSPGLHCFAQAQPVPEEYQMKAAFLFHFAQFVSWPPGALNVGDLSLTLCMFADEPRREELQDTIEGKVIQTRVFHVRLINEPLAIQGCNILFLSRDESRLQTAVLRGLRGMPVLTVGETDNFLLEGGMIRFHFEHDKIRFDINLGGAESSHFKISSRLLVLATEVTEGSGGYQER
jgi:hypothetical protein